MSEKQLLIYNYAVVMKQVERQGDPTAMAMYAALVLVPLGEINSVTTSYQSKIVISRLWRH